MFKHSSEALARCWRNAGLLLGLSLLVWLPTEALAAKIWWLIEHERVAMVMSSLVYALGTAALSGGFMHVFAREAAGRPATLHDAVQVSLRRTPAVFLTGLLVSVFVTFGLVLLVVPAIYAMVVFSLTTVVIVVEGGSGWSAMQRSRALVRGRGWLLFGTVVLMWLAPLALEALIGLGTALLQLPVEAVDIATGWIVVLLQAPVHAALFGFYLEARFDDPD